MNESSERRELLELLCSKAVIYGPRVLASGKTSYYYIDGKQVTLDARGSYLTGRCIFEVIKSAGVQAIGGPTLGADPIVGAVLAEAGRQGTALQGFIVRKETKDHGTSKLIEGAVLRRGSRVALVEDVITTGGSVLKVVHAIEQAGAKVVQIIALVDREEGALSKLASYHYTPLFTKLDLRIKSEEQAPADLS
ncbi:MAG: orotate phosphoribosyltransferase [Candidatus Omnitrophica bacterium]|nr:orotate phosphoribosyltransferase [Candidatus Omnitrophota bacterium]